MSLENETVYTLDVFARISGVDRKTIIHYQQQGFIHPLPDCDDRFDDEALRTLRRIVHLRNTCGVNETGLRLILELLDEVERLRSAY